MDSFVKSDMDLNPLFRLKEAIEGAQLNTTRMLSKLERFENRLIDLDNKMRPIQDSTAHYSMAKNSITSVLAEINKTYEYFGVAEEVKEVIKKGLSVTTQKQFFEALGKLTVAKIFFENHLEIKSAKEILSSIDEQLSKAISSCATEFEKLLQSSGIVVEFVNGQYNVMNPISEATTKEIKEICDVLENNQHHAHFKVYQSVRVSQVKAELKKQETANGAAWTMLLMDVPYERGHHPFREYFFMCYGLLRGELQLWGSTLPSNEESLSIFIAICDVVLGEINRLMVPSLADDNSQRVNGIVKHSKAILFRLDALETMVALYEDFRDVCKPDPRNESSASISLSKLRHSVLHSCLVSSEYLVSRAIITAFSVEKTSHFGALGALTSGLATTASSVDAHKAAGGGGNGGAGSTSTHSLADALSCDSHPATGHILLCCKGLSSLTEAYRTMYAISQRSASNHSLNAISFADCDEFLVAVLDNLLWALDERALKFDEASKVKEARRRLETSASGLFEEDDRVAEEVVVVARKHLFLSNNLYAICNYTKERKKELHAVAETAVAAFNAAGGSVAAAAAASAGAAAASGGSGGVAVKSSSATKRRPPTVRALQQTDAFAEKVEKRLRREQISFCETVAATMGLTPEDMHEFSVLYAKDKSGNGRVLKAKFTIFNTGFDALLAQQGEWRISSSGLREHLGTQLRDAIVPVYTTFFSTYSVVKFSKKHMTEYLRYKPSDVESKLKAFFGRNPTSAS